jgi:hypothetical protein
VSIFKMEPAQPGDVIAPSQAERILAGQLLQEQRILNQTTTERAARLQSQVVNGVLEAGTWVLDASGQLTKHYHATIGSVVVTNVTGAQIVVTAGSAGPSAPASGDGVHLVPAGVIMTLPIAARDLTIYGTVGGLISLQCWTGLQPYGVTG